MMMQHTTPTLAGPSASAHRLPFLDALRVLAFGLLVLYHVGMYYVTWDWHVKSPAASDALEPWMLLSAPWRMGLLFLISGVATAAMQRSTGFVAKRSSRLLWPLLFGMLVLVPPQAYLEVREKLQYPGSFVDFMGLYLSGYGVFCKDAQCLSMPSWNHLWFLPYVWVYGMLTWGLQRVAPAWVAQARARLDRVGLWGVVLMALPLMAARQAVGAFPSTHNLSWDWYNHAQYGWLFLVGWVASGQGLWAQMARLRWVALVAALIAWVALLLYFAHYAEATPPEGLRAAMRCVWGLMQWSALVACVGWTYQALNTPRVWVKRLDPLVFCAYVLHQTLIVLLSQALRPLALAPLLEGGLLVVLTYALCALGYWLARPIPGLSTLLGIATPSPRASEPAPQGAQAATVNR